MASIAEVASGRFSKETLKQLVYISLRVQGDRIIVNLHELLNPNAELTPDQKEIKKRILMISALLFKICPFCCQNVDNGPALLWRNNRAITLHWDEACVKRSFDIVSSMADDNAERKINDGIRIIFSEIAFSLADVKY